MRNHRHRHGTTPFVAPLSCRYLLSGMLINLALDRDEDTSTLLSSGGRNIAMRHPSLPGILKSPRRGMPCVCLVAGTGLLLNGIASPHTAHARHAATGRRDPGFIIAVTNTEHLNIVLLTAG